MNALIEQVARWEPTTNIPATPCADFALESYETGRLDLTMRYSWIKGNIADLWLSFSEVRAIRTFWDGDGIGWFDGDLPRFSGAHSGFIWPLLEIEPSRWLASGEFAASIAIAEALGQESWHHYRVLTLERSLDVLARGAVQAKWLPKSG